ncbi:MAG: hypothetical protein H7Y00_10615 [Fimbriimonadaceae bacterium]|nr:hypothetical protein [Chitinophagales bacterium]
MEKHFVIFVFTFVAIFLKIGFSQSDTKIEGYNYHPIENIYILDTVNFKGSLGIYGRHLTDDIDYFYVGIVVPDTFAIAPDISRLKSDGLVFISYAKIKNFNTRAYEEVGIYDRHYYSDLIDSTEYSLIRCEDISHKKKNCYYKLDTKLIHGLIDVRELRKIIPVDEIFNLPEFGYVLFVSPFVKAD